MDQSPASSTANSAVATAVPDMRKSGSAIAALVISQSAQNDLPSVSLLASSVPMKLASEELSEALQTSLQFPHGTVLASHGSAASGNGLEKPAGNSVPTSLQSPRGSVAAPAAASAGRPSVVVASQKAGAIVASLLAGANMGSDVLLDPVPFPGSETVSPTELASAAQSVHTDRPMVQVKPGSFQVNAGSISDIARIGAQSAFSAPVSAAHSNEAVIGSSTRNPVPEAATTTKVGGQIFTVRVHLDSAVYMNNQTTFTVTDGAAPIHVGSSQPATITMPALTTTAVDDPSTPDRAGHVGTSAVGSSSSMAKRIRWLFSACISTIALIYM